MSTIYRTVNVTVDAVCAVFTLMVLLYLRFGPDRRERLSRLLSWVCVLNIGMLLGDIPNWLCEGFGQPWYPLALHGGLFVLYLSGCLVTWVYSLYICAYLSTKITLKRWTLSTIHTIFGVSCALLLLNYTNNMYYYIDAQNIYHRGELYWLSQLLPVVVMVFDAVVILRHRRVLRAQETVAFISYLVLPIVGVLIQLWLYGVSATYFACTISLFIIFFCVQSEQRMLTERQKRELDIARVSVMLSQIQPHFLYNTLQSIRLLCDTEPARASQALEHFAFYLRGNLDSLTSEHLVSFEKELVHIRDYLYLEKMRFADELEVLWELDCHSFALPPLTVQPLIENAIRHGLNKKPGGGTLIIKSEETASGVVVTVLDNGVGFDPQCLPQDDRTHIGIENARSRLAALCGGTLQIESQKGVGTTARVILPHGGAAK